MFTSPFPYICFFRGEICSWASAQRRNEGRSITLRARVGQTCDFRGTLKPSINKLEAITGLRSGGLPEPHRKKIYLDSLDLSITMRDILHTFFKSNANSPDEDLHKIFILGVQSWSKQVIDTINPYSKLIAYLYYFVLKARHISSHYGLQRDKHL